MNNSLFIFSISALMAMASRDPYINNIFKNGGKGGGQRTKRKVKGKGFGRGKKSKFLDTVGMRPSHLVFKENEGMGKLYKRRGY